jgi:anaerobic magnesium-protoporphyrin IX monomethyl ester cyclase
MTLNIVLLTPRRQFIANRFGLGYQIPLGLVLIGGPLLDAGHQVRLIDNDVSGWDNDRLARELVKTPPDCLMIGHTGSTAAHPVAMDTARYLKQHLPDTTFVYGGVYPSYAARTILHDNPAIDIVVRGEGEETVIDLAGALAGDQSALARVKGITWRDGDRIRTNPNRRPITNLDRFRPGWELVNWDAYQLFGFGRAAGLQFSRGCTLHCTYCGQWGFWRRWRHHSPVNFADELETLARHYGVRIVWLADENFAADRETAQQALEHLAARQLDLSLNLNMTAADVVRDADLMPLYKRAGVDNIIMGIESLDDKTMAKVRKNNPFKTSRQAVRLLRQNGIVSLVNIIYGLEDENFSTLGRTFHQLFRLDPDVMNAVYITPHFWTQMGQEVESERIIEPNQARWTYRNQVVHTPRLTPWRLFLSVKLTEALFHLRPRALWRMVSASDRRYRQILQAYLTTGVRVVLAEIGEFLFNAPPVPASPPTYTSEYLTT